jgi:hypothetical protein
MKTATLSFRLLYVVAKVVSLVLRPVELWQLGVDLFCGVNCSARGLGLPARTQDSSGQTTTSNLDMTGMGYPLKQRHVRHYHLPQKSPAAIHSRL